MKIFSSVFSLACLFLSLQLLAQTTPKPNAFAFKLKTPITLDGVLDEEIWKDTEGWSGDFMQFFPSDTSLSVVPTRVKIAYDDTNIYLAAIMENRGPRKYVSTSLRRDYRGEQNDGVSFVFDTFNDGTNAFQFGVNPYGVQREALVSNGGTRPDDLNLAWDNKWFSEAKIMEKHWQVEVIIHFLPCDLAKELKIGASISVGSIATPVSALLGPQSQELSPSFLLLFFEK